MIGPEGQYTLQFAPDPNDEWEGGIDVLFPNETRWWPVLRVDSDENGMSLGGMASIDAWKDSFWFSLWPEAHPPRIEYWGNQVIWRIDREV
jgi:hypothetical protein